MVGFPREYKILGGIALGAIVIAVLLFKFAAEPKTAAPLVDRAGAYSKGLNDAKVVVTEFADFQCPACKSAQSLIEQIQTDYPRDVRFVFRHFPLPSHPHAQITALAAETAGAQGKFWEMHDYLYTRQDEWGDTTKNISTEKVTELLSGYASVIGLDATKFANDMNAATYRAAIIEDTNAAAAAGVNATPTFFVNGVKINALSYDALKKAIDEALTK